MGGRGVLAAMALRLPGESAWSGMGRRARLWVVLLAVALSASGAMARLAVGLGCSGGRCAIATTAALGLSSCVYAIVAGTCAAVLAGAVAPATRGRRAALLAGAVPFGVLSLAFLVAFGPA